MLIADVANYAEGFFVVSVAMGVLLFGGMIFRRTR